ncbi:hypothetical protein [Pedobacter caeni]|uniref:Uncharacterized protein n=1 Tax=Pedobacter caeni TaxID=288992 RepID=A0A1M4UHM6_9SPHI|nr:hypothetical protein [Pedobacter caeni]SHE56148.1 hypothetical protein SAMN04488522_101563 [Pedobacter caeni]
MMPKELISKKDNIIIYCVFGLPMLVLIGFVLYTAFSGPNREELRIQDDVSLNFNGRVDSMYFDERNHNGKYAVLNTNQIFPIYRNWERNIHIGDSLSKEKGTFLLEIYKKNKTKVTLNYMDTYKRFPGSARGWTLVLIESAALDFNGKIDSVYYDQKNHNTKTVVLKDGYTYGIWAAWEPFIEIGDSLSKKRGSLDLIVYKKNKGKMILNYQTLWKSN